MHATHTPPKSAVERSPAAHDDRAREETTDAPWTVLVLLAIAQFMVILDVTVVNVALPSIGEALSFSSGQLQWVITAYVLFTGGLMLLGGRLADLVGRRAVFLGGLGIFTAASLASGFAWSAESLIVARAVQGIGAALLLPSALSIITTTYDGRRRAVALSVWGALGSAGAAAGVLLGGILTTALSWEWIFFINVPIGVGIVLAAFRLVPNSRVEGGNRHFDLAGAVSVTAGLLVLVYAIVKAEEWGWGSGSTLGLAAVAVVLLAAFIVIERRSPFPLVRLGLFRMRSLAAANGVFLMVAGGLFALFFFSSLYLQNILGYSPLEAGIRFLPTTLVIMVVAPIAGRLTDRIGPRPLIVAGLAIVAVSLLMQSRIEVDTGFSRLLIPFILMGLGIALTMSPMSTAAMNAVAEAKSGLASGLLSMARMIGGTFGVAVLGAIFQGQSRASLDSALADTGIATHRIDLIAEQLGSGGLDATLSGLPPAQLEQATAAAREAFVSSLATAIGISGAVAAAGAVLAIFLISAKATDAEPEAVADVQPATPSLAADAPR